MTLTTHAKDVSILAALADPIRLEIVKRLVEGSGNHRSGVGDAPRHQSRVALSSCGHPCRGRCGDEAQSGTDRVPAPQRETPATMHHEARCAFAQQTGWTTSNGRNVQEAMMSTTFNATIEHVTHTTSRATIRRHTFLVDRGVANGGFDLGPAGESTCWCRWAAASPAIFLR